MMSASTAVVNYNHSCDVPFLCRFLDAPHEETLPARGRPASTKRQGTKSRQVWRVQGSACYGVCMWPEGRFGLPIEPPSE
jgi:hypothetical protein